MYNDCWPSDSWAVVDYYGNPKAGWYACKKSCRSVMGSIDKKDGKYVLNVMNDGRKDVEGTVKVTLWNVHKNLPEQELEMPFITYGNTVTELCRLDWELPEEDYLLVMDVITKEEAYPYRTVYFPKRIADLHLPSSNGERTVHIIEQGSDFITLCADKYTHMVDLDGDYIFEDNYFTMLPGETRTIRFRQTAMAATTEIQLYGI